MNWSKKDWVKDRTSLVESLKEYQVLLFYLPQKRTLEGVNIGHMEEWGLEGATFHFIIFILTVRAPHCGVGERLSL